METLMNAAREIAGAPHGERGDIVRRTAQMLNLSVQRTHTLVSQAARELGLAKPRRRRADAGQSAMSKSELELIAGVMLYDRRNGKAMIPLGETLDALHADGKLANPLSPSRVACLLREAGLSMRSLTAPAPHTHMRTEHVNAVWQIDASVCVLYKTPKGELLLLEEDGVHYKNKPGNLVRVMDQLLVRFVATEHASGAVATRFYTGGETTENALDFLMWVMTQRIDAKGTAMPFHGVPFMLYTDQGGCFKSTAFRNFCAVMGIRQEWHKPRNSRATGQVENAQNLVERGLESRLRFMDPASITIARLNAMGELWMHAFNGTRRHSRHRMTRYVAWATIGTEHLRIAPSMEIMRSLPMSLSETRTVSGDMRVAFAIKGKGSQSFDVRYVPGVSPGDKVFVAINPFAAPAVRVGVTDMDTGEILWHDVQPVEKGWMGYDATAPVLEKSQYQAMPATPADERRERLATAAFGDVGKAIARDRAKAVKAVPYAGQFNPLADIEAKAASLPTYLQQRGTAHGIAPTGVAEERLSVAAACQLMRVDLAGDYDSGTYAWLTERHGADGVPISGVRGLIAARRQALDAPTAPEAPALRVVGG